MLSTAGLWQSIVIFLSLGTLLYLYNKNVRDIKKELILAAAISALWVYFAGWYEYEQSNYFFLGLNLFAFIAWTTGLVLIREIYEWLPRKSRFIIASLLWLILVPTLEYIGYNYWMIQLDAGYAGLFGLPLMHMPWYGQAYYLLIGPAFLLVTDKMRVR